MLDSAQPEKRTKEVELEYYAHPYQSTPQYSAG